MKRGEIMADGSKYGETFSGEEYKGGYPHRIEGEHFEKYQERIEKDYVSKGFHLGDLSCSDYFFYCGGEETEEWED